MGKIIGVLLCVFALLIGDVQAANFEGATCIAPAKPKGGFDVTCQLLNEALLKNKEIKKPLSIIYQPGGVGALAFNTTIRQYPSDKSRLIAFSSGTLLNLAQDRFGSYTIDDVKWLAVVGIDHGVVVVNKNSPFSNLASLLEALKSSPDQIAFGTSGTIGSQDWIKAALIAKAAGLSHKQMKVVVFEGGGDALNALQGGHIQVFTGDTGEVTKMMLAGQVKVLAVLADQRIPSSWSNVPTAKEQGYDIKWSSLRGIYLGPSVIDSDRRDLENAITRSITKSSYEGYLSKHGFQYQRITGVELQQLVRKTYEDYKQLLREFGI